MKNKQYFFIIVCLYFFSKQINTQAVIADSLFKAQQWESSAVAYNSYLQTNPKDKPGFQLNKIGQCFFNLQQYDKAIDAFKKSVVYNGSANIMYNIACAYSKSSQEDSALTWLERSANAGYTQYQSTLEDEDFKNLHDNARFNIITDKIKKNVSPCSFQQESQQFNFWIGEWKVYDLQG